MITNSNNQESNRLTRVHKFISQQSDRFSIYNEDENLAKSILIYICHYYDEDIFGFGRIDLNHFCKTMKYKSKSDLFEKVQLPAQLKGLPSEAVMEIRENGEVWESKFENALFRLANEPLKFIVSDKTDPNYHMTQTDFRQLITTLRIYVNPRNRNKKYYEYKATTFFKEYISNYYDNINLKSFNDLRKPKLQDLYLYLIALKEQMKVKVETKITPNFDLLCRKAIINPHLEPKYKKRDLKKALKMIQERAPDLNMSVAWGMNGKYAYQPILNFGEWKLITDKEKKDNRIKIFNRNLAHEFFETWKNIFGISFVPEEETYQIQKDFVKWFQDKKANRKEKSQAYINAHKFTWPRKPITIGDKKLEFYLDHQRHITDEVD